MTRTSSVETARATEIPASPGRSDESEPRPAAGGRNAAPFLGRPTTPAVQAPAGERLASNPLPLSPEPRPVDHGLAGDLDSEARRAHEREVAAFYGTGLDRLDEDLNWELTYGFWRSDSDTYAEAAINMWDEVFRGLDLVAGESVVVDVAPGMGKELIYLYRKYRPRKIVAVDITPQHVLRANRLIAKHGLSDHIQVILGSGTELDKHFGAGFATHVICVEGTVQMKHRSEFFRSAKAVLRPQGVLGICDSTLRRAPGLFRPLLGLVTRAWKVPPENAMTGAQIGQQLKKLGFAVSIREIGDRVWAPYCRAKRKEFKGDIERRGFAHAIGFALINHLIALADWTGSMGYSVIVARTCPAAQGAEADNRGS